MRRGNTATGNKQPEINGLDLDQRRRKATVGVACCIANCQFRQMGINNSGILTSLAMRFTAGRNQLQHTNNWGFMQRLCRSYSTRLCTNINAGARYSYNYGRNDRRAPQTTVPFYEREAQRPRATINCNYGAQRPAGTTLRRGGCIIHISSA
jgi:hypothetical protein